MPRRYTLGKRAEQHASTRERIVSAALGLIRQGGLRAASVRAVAAAADVAPATVRNHFPDRAALADAAADAVLAEIHPPGVEIFAGLTSATGRVERLARELSAFADRSVAWWNVQQADPDLVAAWAGQEAKFAEHQRRLVEAAVEPLGEDPVAVAVTTNIVGYSMYYGLLSQGLSSEDVVQVQLSVILPWLEQRSG
ncbi:MAG: TetR family transcriptional regulator [Chloroflexi bacterium]|nr:TetR family transcriptional regulator [Chloroflexota bacterium]